MLEQLSATTAGRPNATGTASSSWLTSNKTTSSPHCRRRVASTRQFTPTPKVSSPHTASITGQKKIPLCGTYRLVIKLEPSELTTGKKNLSNFFQNNLQPVLLVSTAWFAEVKWEWWWRMPCLIRSWRGMSELT